MSNDRRYTFRGCGCGDAFCAGCDDEAWPAIGDTEREIIRARAVAAPGGRVHRQLLERVLRRLRMPGVRYELENGAARVTDDDRVLKAVRRNGRMLGPIERQRCARHPKRWEMYRWTWPVGSAPDVGDAECVRACGACADEDQP